MASAAPDRVTLTFGTESVNYRKAEESLSPIVRDGGYRERESIKLASLVAEVALTRPPGHPGYATSLFESCFPEIVDKSINYGYFPHDLCNEMRAWIISGQASHPYDLGYNLGPHTNEHYSGFHEAVITGDFLPLFFAALYGMIIQEPFRGPDDFAYRHIERYLVGLDSEIHLIEVLRKNNVMKKVQDLRQKIREEAKPVQMPPVRGVGGCGDPLLRHLQLARRNRLTS